MTSPASVAIIGCGPAGQAAAILLARRGWNVRLFEQSPRLGPVGAGILLQPSGLSVLQQLGALPRVLELGAPVHRLHGITDRGRTVLDIAYSDLDPGAFGLGVSRGMLFETLQTLVGAAGVSIESGRRILQLDGDFTCAPMLVDDSGYSEGPFDLVIIADGARSVLRDQLGHVARAVPYPWGALWIVVPDPENRHAGALRQIYRSTTHMLGTVPTGRATFGALPSVSLFWSLRADTHQTVRAAGLDAWKRSVRELTRGVDDILDQLYSMDQLLYAAYWDVVLHSLHRGRIVCIGDAAHAMSPQLGQGANLALLDAAALAESLSASRNVESGLAAFEKIRSRQTRYYSWASRVLTPVFQSSDEWLAGPRDLLGGTMCHLPWVRAQMLQSLAGIKSGFFTARPLPRIATTAQTLLPPQTSTTATPITSGSPRLHSSSLQASPQR